VISAMQAANVPGRGQLSSLWRRQQPSCRNVLSRAIY